MSRGMAKAPKNHTPGEVRYFTYWLRFPDGDEWVDQEPFVHDLQFELKNTHFANDPFKSRDLLTRGETHWKDQNGVEHVVRIESAVRPRKWGVKRNRR